MALREGEPDAPPPEGRSSPEGKAATPAMTGERRAEDLTAGAPARLTEPATTPAAAPPALPAATLRQIADAVATGASSLPDAAAVRAGAVAAAWSAAAQAEGPVRLLTLQLRPAELGPVLVRMRLQDGRLEMSLRAEREETAELLRRDGGLLTELVRNAGYRPDLVTIEAGRLAGQPGGQPEAPQGGQAFQAPTGGQGQQGGAAPDQPARRTPDAPEEGGRRTTEQRDEAHPGDRGRGGLYL
ncbi:flagellar hook-length control protein FliK [Methylobacterium variabile]|jgi:flagellar hook-length control protein FliK|uniref:flagellar hook-length control protein FliK n=1 Tax=Methylobacterium variabile TaxID=298794 RepID=UPI000A64E687|nr:flagellar hook-length control protein FliK [Methylobacterium variabile]